MTGQPNDPKALWRDQPTDTTPMTLAQIHARGFQAHIRRRNLIEYVAAAIVVAGFSTYVVVIPDPILKLASVLVVLGALYVAFQLHRRGSARPTPSTDALAFHRAELVRQREALRSAWRWYLAPVAPGLLLFIAGMFRVFPEDTPTTLKLLVPGLTAAYVVIWAWRNRRAQQRLAAAIAELDQLAERGA